MGNLWSDFIGAQKWRWLGLMAVAFVSIAAITYYFAYQVYVQDAQSQAANQAANGRATLISISKQHTPLLYALSQSSKVHDVLKGGSVAKLNKHLLELNQRANLEAIYLMDADGLTLAASNYQEAINYVGKNYSFRPYFKQAMAGETSDFFAIGATTGKPGYFISQPVFNQQNNVIGVITAKFSVASFLPLWPSKELRGFVSNKDNVIILASDKQWLYRTLNTLSTEQITVIKAQKQFANLQLQNLDWTPLATGQATIAEESFLYANTATLSNGWQLHMLIKTSGVRTQSMITAALISTAIFFLWAWALVIRSKRLKKALLNSEQDRQQLVSVNQQMQREIGERIEAEAKLAKAQGKLVQSSRMAALGQLSASVIHELGQPLTALKTYIAAAELDSPSKPMINLLANLQRVTKRMQMTTDELRLFSRPGDLQMQSVHLTEVINKSLSLIAQSHDHHAVIIEEDFEGNDTAQVTGHDHRLEQVITNLVSNALTALVNTSNPKIMIHIKDDGQNWIIDITDNGPGFGIRDPKRLFEAFYTTKSEQQGMGLGLAISAAIVEEHHGKIWAAQNPQGGAIFYVSLPKTMPAKGKVS